MRSYFVSFSAVTALLFGYTALVLTTHAPARTDAPHASVEAEHRRPATSVSVPVQAADTTNVD